MDSRFTPTSVLCEFTKLRSQQKLLESGRSQYDANWPTPDIPSIRQELDQTFAEHRSAKWSEVQNISDTMRSFREQMLSPNGLRTHKTIEFREEVLRVDGLLRETMAKNSAEMIELSEQQACMCQEEEVTKMEVLLSTSSPLHVNSLRKKTVGDIGALCRQDNEEVRRFFDFVVRHGGHSGGWSAEEHQRFVRLKSKYGTNVKLIVASILKENNGAGL